MPCFAVGPAHQAVLDEGLQAQIKAELSSLLLGLLESRESESIINGLNILGALCGFGSDFGKSKAQVSEKHAFFRRNSLLIPIAVWEKVFAFQESWDITIQIASILILQIALPVEYGKYIYKKRKQRVKMSQDLLKSQDSQQKPRSKASMATECAEKDPQRASLQGALGLGPQEGGRQLDSLLRALHSVSQGAHASGKLATHDFTGVEKANHSVTAVSGDQLSEEAASAEFNWLEKRFEEQELRQLLNLFKMNFAKEENKWNKLEFSDKHLEIVFERDNSVQNPKPGYTDELEKTESTPLPSPSDAGTAPAGSPEKNLEAEAEAARTPLVGLQPQPQPLPNPKPQTPVEPSPADLSPAFDSPQKRPKKPKPAEKPRGLSEDEDDREKKYHFGKKPKAANTSVDESASKPPTKPSDAFFGDKPSKDKTDSMRRNSTRKEISRILSTHLAKSPVDSTLRHTVSPKHAHMDVNYIANLIRHTVTSNSRPRIMSRQRDKNCSAGSLIDKKDKPLALTHIDQLKTLAKKPHETVLSNLKKKIFSKAGGDFRKGVSNDQLHKQSLVSMIGRAAAEQKFKSSALLRPSRQGTKSAKVDSVE